MSDLREILDLYDRLVAVAVGVVPDDAVERAAEVGRAARRRLGYLGDTVLVAFAGGTGSGKSSLLNALAGEEVSAPGARRPTTAEPVAWIPANPEPGLTRLLDDIDIDCRVGQDLHPWLAVVDLPDTDSVVPEHRARVERLLPLVDCIVWVVDPEKYQDARLHRDHLAPLAAHADRFVFALNQVDRIGRAEAQALEADLRRSLAADGIGDPQIVLTAGDPPDGLHRGLDELLAAIRALGSAADVVSRRVVDELVAAADRVVAPLGGAGGTGFVSRWTAARNEVAESVAAAVDADLRREGDAVARRDVAAISGWLTSRRPADVIEARSTNVSTGVADPLRNVVDESARSLDPGSRAAVYDVAGRIDDEVAAVAATIGATTTVPLAEPPAWWSSVRLLSYLCAAAVVLGAVWAFDAWRSGEGVFAGVAMMIAGGAARAGLRAWARRSTRERVDAALTARHDESSARATAELERRVGRPLRTTLRARSAPGAAHAELMLAVTRYEERET